MDIRGILRTLETHGVRYLLAGGVDAALYGCPEPTYDVDILYDLAEDNLGRLLQALQAMEAERGEPYDAEILRRQYVVSFSTKHGYLDAFHYLKGVGNYADALQWAERIAIEDLEVARLNLEGLIRAKEAALPEEKNPRKLAALQYLRDLRALLDRKAQAPDSV